MFIKFKDVTVNTDAVSFSVEKGPNCEIHFIGVESITVPQEITGGFFAGAPTMEDIQKLQEEQARAMSSGIVKPNIVMK